MRVGRSRIACALVAAVALSVALPHASAVAPALEATGVLAVPIPIASLGTDAQAPSTLPDATPTCRTTTFHPDADGRSFRFTETAQETGCLAVLYNVTLPDGVRDLVLTFDANRTVRQQMLHSPSPPQMAQQVRLLADGQIRTVLPVFNDDEPDRPRQPFDLPFQVPDDTTRVQLEWYFADEGRLAGANGPGQFDAFSATVWNPVVTLPDVALLPPTAVATGGTLQRGGEYLAEYTAAATVPPEYRTAAAGGDFTLTLRTDAAALVVRVDGPDGHELDPALYSGSLDSGHRSVTLPAATLSSLGPGPYTVHMEAAEPLEARPAFAALSYVAVAAPGLAIAAAWFGLRRTEVDPGEADG